MTSILVNKTISEYFPDGVNKCVLPLDLLKLCIEYNVEVKKEYYKNGKLKKETPFVNGKEHGVSKTWYDNGVLFYETSFVYGKKHGVCKGWYNNGNPFYIKHYLDNKAHGISKSWYDNRSLKFEHKYF